MTACMTRRHGLAPWRGSASVQGDDDRSTAGAPATPLEGAAPGDEHGPGGFVSRQEEKSFYPASGGQLWYYLNLYYWAPKGLDTKDLWIREEVVEEWQDLRHWPDGASVASPPPKVTHEYWEVGASGRTMAIDNHKDFWLEADGWCDGAIAVRMTLQLGRLRIRKPGQDWARPRAHYVLDRCSYGDAKGLGEGNARFEPLDGRPVTVWAYRIPWSEHPNKLTRSAWQRLKVPDIEFVRREDAEPVARTPVTTEDR